MTPHTIVTKLGQMRRREQLLRLVWGVARWLVLAVVLLGLCCALDWVVDRYNDTPGILFALMIGAQVAAWTAAFVFLILLPMSRLLSDDDLTLAVEEGNPSLYHRLISALQLNRPGANTKGMSKELIDIVTLEAEKEAARLDFTSVLDHSRLKKAGLILGPLALVVVALFVLMPQTLPTLLARQFGGNVDIPRSVEVTNVSRDVWPEGDEVTLEFVVKGEGVDEALSGKAIVQHLWGATNEYALAYDRKTDGGAVFTARVPASFNDFSFRARVRDGRTRKDGRITFKPRPVVTGQAASVLRPAYLGLKPDGSRYEIEMEKGDINALPGHGAKVLVRTSKPVVKATLELLSSQVGDAESVFKQIAMRKFDVSRGDLWEATFDVDEKATAYRVKVEDENGFTNLKAPQRTISLLGDELPTVTMLKDDRFIGETDQKIFDENEVEGMPLKLGAAIRVAYRCKSPYGLHKANLRYRVNEGEWLTFPLIEFKQTEASGPFVPERGIFKNSGPNDKVNFHAMNSPDLEAEPARLQGGGRFDFETSPIKGLKADDQLEYYVEVFDRNPEKGRGPGVSTPPMVKRVVSKEDFDRWVLDTLKQEQKLRDLKEAQEKATKGNED